MKLYQENNTVIFLSQADDPLMNHLFQKVIKYLPEGNGRRMLDIGCGVGRFASLAAAWGYKVEGIEIKKAPFLIASEKYGYLKNIKFLQGDFIKYKFDESSFDVVVCTEVIEHVVHPEAVINKIRRVLKKGGLCILTTPHNQKYWTVLDRYAEHKKRFSEKEIRGLFQSYRIVKLFTVGFPFMLLVMKMYSLMTFVFNVKHTASWRSSSINSVYRHIVKLGLKFDDLFNNFMRGTNFVVVALKPID